MNKLSNYSNKEQDFIINLGLFNYKKTREFVEKDEDFLKKWEKDEEKIENLSLKEKIFELEKKSNQKIDEKVAYYEEKLEKVDNDRRELIAMFEINVKSRVSTTIEAYKKQIEELEKKNKYYYDLYIAKEKGNNYENEIGNLLNEYNEKYFIIVKLIIVTILSE